MTGLPILDLNVIITGATGGLSRVLARTMRQYGTNLLLTARSEPKLNDLAKMLLSGTSSGQVVDVMAVDLTAHGAAGLIMARARKLWGGWTCWSITQPAWGQ
jgi:short-subunit dehydrogenase